MVAETTGPLTTMRLNLALVSRVTHAAPPRRRPRCALPLSDGMETSTAFARASLIEA